MRDPPPIAATSPKHPDGAGGSRTGRHRLPALVGLLLGAAATAAGAQQPVPPPAAQNPSPMVEHTRAHRRLQPVQPPGTERSFAGPLGKPVVVFIPAGMRAAGAGALRLVVEFLGAPYVTEQAVSRLGGRTIAAVVNLGAGSGVYAQTFAAPEVFDSLLAGIRREAGAVLGRPVSFHELTLVGFSAGHGAVRSILSDPRHLGRISSVLLLDGLHTGYLPPRTVMADGGTLDTTNLAVFVAFARAAEAGRKRFLVTHSEIFPGTFASTTETTDYLVGALGLERTPVLRWGPLGMQQLSEVKQGRFELLGFAGNAAPDHIDQFQSMPDMLRRLEGP